MNSEIPSEEAGVEEIETEVTDGDGNGKGDGNGNGDDRDDRAEGGEQVKEEEPEKRDEISQRILNIMANFLEGEVRDCPTYWEFKCMSHSS